MHYENYGAESDSGRQHADGPIIITKSMALSLMRPPSLLGLPP